MTTLLEELELVRERIDSGWIQGRFEWLDDTGCVRWCLHGATRYTNHRHAVITAIQDVIGVRSTIEWNDRPWRTKEHVLTVVDEAIARVKSRGEVTFLSMADPPGTTRIKIIKEKLASMNA